MTIAILSVNHNKAPIDIREKVVFAPDKLTEFIQNLNAQKNILSNVILSTCNRSEVYINTAENDVENIEKTLIDWFAKIHNLEQKNLNEFLDFLVEEEAIKHIFSVASGLDSLVLGEPQILGQLKEAYQTSKNINGLDKDLEYLFQQSFRVAKTIRTNTKIGANSVSVAYCSVKLAEKIFSDLSQQNALLIGAGEMIELCAKHLQDKNIKKIIIANRTTEKAQLIANKYKNSEVIILNELSNKSHQADIIISSTASPIPIIGKGLIEKNLKKRKNKPIFILDIAVPRDVESEVGDLSNTYLYTIDDLTQIVEQNTKSRQQEKEQAVEMVNLETQKFLSQVDSLFSEELIKKYRQYANEIRDKTLKNAIKDIDNGKDINEVLKKTVEQLTNRLIHHPSKVLREKHYDENFQKIAKTLLIQ
ncbi:Glutamyl-tRNA reductase [hydrothermal vent metagenome]|uniref:glutamyl-tRNA reductase n=1 Tax=hydrothermal vent metagenome TaxID=652676 RepID=A0A1W1BMS5_9ZZZZ